MANDVETQEKDLGSEILVQEPVNGEETEVTETQVIYQEDQDGAQEPPMFEEQEELPEEHIEVQCNNVQMFIKGEPEQEQEEEEVINTQMFMDEQSRDEELEEEQEIQYGESEPEVNLEQSFEEEENVDVKTGKYKQCLNIICSLIHL